MAIQVNNISLIDWSDPTVIANGVSGHRDADSIACRLTLTAAANGQLQNGHHYVIRFQDQATGTQHEWNVEATTIPSDPTVPFNFKVIKPRK